MNVDFTQPKGEAALIPPDSVSWQVFKNPVSLYIGGITAVILEFADPRIRSGVWDHSTFRDDPIPRLKRTSLAALLTVYGPKSRAERMIAGVTQMHRRVVGSTPDGVAYQALDAELMNWVQATASFGFMEAYHAYVCPLSAEQKDVFYREAQPGARLFGAHDSPGSVADWQQQLEHMSRNFEPHPIITDFLNIMRSTRALPWPLRPMNSLFINAAVALLPPALVTTLALEHYQLSAWQAGLVTGVARLANRIKLNQSPAVQACRRLGLPADYLYT